jgi:predicted nucleic acid-binding Zn finger protein
MTIAQPRTVPNSNTRELRALELYRERGEEIRHLSGSYYRVPSQDGQRSYDVEYGERERCACPDYLYRGGERSCVHLYCLGIAIAKGSIVHPELAAGDPFIAAAKNRPCACMDGWVYLGRVVESEHDLDGEVVEYERVPCRRCADSR